MLLATALALFGAAVVIFLGGATVSHFYPSWLGRIGQHAIAESIVDGLRFDPSGRPIAAEVPPALDRVFGALRTELFYRVVDETGRVLLSSDGGTSAITHNGGALGASPAEFSLGVGETALHVMTVRVGPVQRSSYLQVVRSDRFDQVVLTIAGSVARRTATAVVIAALVVFFLVIFLTTRRMIAQLRRVGDEAAKIDLDHLTQRLRTEGVPAEVAPLVQMFNVVLARLEKGFRVQQEFLATAAHELKTPITLMRGEIEINGTADSAVLLEDLDHMARQVQQLLHLAETSEPQNYQIELLDIEQLVVATVDHLSRLASARAISVHVACPVRAEIQADNGSTHVLVRNLLENAIHHSPRGSQVSIEVSRKGIVVRDHGPGVSEKDMPFLFKRFWRGAHRRDDGAGLGLAICKQIADRHGWLIEVRNQPSGAQFSVTFGVPIEPAGAAGA